MWYLISIILLAICVPTVIWIIMRVYEKKYIRALNELPDGLDSIIILGAGIRKDGKPCDLLADRLEVGAKAYIDANANTILLTGDNCDNSRREVDVMRDWIIKNHLKNNIEEDKVLLDNLGLCTYHSMYRAKKIFKINTAIISTNRYHLPRAIYIARRIGIEAYGVSSDLRTYDRMKKYKKRELLAQIKDFILVNFNKIIGCLYKDVL